MQVWLTCAAFCSASNFSSNVAIGANAIMNDFSLRAVHSYDSLAQRDCDALAAPTGQLATCCVGKSQMPERTNNAEKQKQTNIRKQRKMLYMVAFTCTFVDGSPYRKQT
jgi:hypothetical protein